MLRLVLPKGSLERATMQLFEEADLAVRRASDVAYRASIEDPRISEVRILRPQEIPVYVADGLFELGITGRDCVEERGSEVVSLGKLSYSKNTANPARVVLAVGADSPVASLAELAAATAGRADPPAASAPSTPSSPVRRSLRTGSRPTSPCLTAPPRRRCPTSPTRSST